MDWDKKIKGIGYWGWDGKKPTKLPKKFKMIYPKADVFIPNERICTKWPRKYFKYGEYDEKLHSDIMIHCRVESKFGRDNRNLPPRKFEKLISMLRNDRELSICSIGTFEGAAYVKGTLDLRNIPLEELCNRMASSTLTMGVSSGPIHAASLCCCPHISWSDNKRQRAIKATNKERYSSLWNPFDTPVIFLNKFGWKPPIIEIYEATKEMLANQGAWDGSAWLRNRKA